MKLVRYSVELESQWNAFVAKAVNGVFLFDRGYMDYHADRFSDHSLIVIDERDNWLAVIPAACRDGVWASHAGLTYGGLVMATELSQCKVIDCVKLCVAYFRDNGFHSSVFKLIPDIYGETIIKTLDYALFSEGFSLYRRDASTTLFLSDQRKKTKGRNAAIKKAKKLGIDVSESQDFNAFMELENQNLQRKYGVSAVHTAAEMTMLAGRFPENIRLFVAREAGQMIAGGIVYVSRRVMHLQYMATNGRGAELSAGDLVIDAMIQHCAALTINIFDFGISTENDGQFLNTGLIKYKESFGGKTTLADFYRLEFNA